MCPADKLVPVPDGVDDSTAAGSYINPLTAWALTLSTHKLNEGDWLLQTAAAFSVGRFVLQLAQQYRFKTINVIRRREQESIVRNLGGNEVICTADEDLRSRLQELTAGKGVERAMTALPGNLALKLPATWLRLEPCLCMERFPVIGRWTPRSSPCRSSLRG